MIYLILVAVLIVLLILAGPISLGYDSVEKWFKVKWLGLTLTKRTKLKREKPKKPGKSIQRRKMRGWAVMRRLWQQRDLCLELIQRVYRFILEVFKTLNFRDSEAVISLPDPMWNGLLYAVVTNIHLENMDLSVNFEQRNYAKIWVTVYPYRIALKLAALLVRLPYMWILRFAWDLKRMRQSHKN